MELTSAAGHEPLVQEEIEFMGVDEDMDKQPKSCLWRYRYLVAGVTGGMLVAGAVVIVLVLHFSSSSSGSQGTFIWLSDIHYDRYYNGSLSSKCHCNSFEYRSSALAQKQLKTNMSDAECAALNDGKFNAYTRSGCEASYALVESTLADAARELPAPDFIVVTGDYNRHNADWMGEDAEATVVNSIETVSTLVARYFANATVLHMPSDLPGGASGLVLGNNDFLPDYGTPYHNYLVQVRGAAAGSAIWTAAQINRFEQGGFSVFQLQESLYAVNLNTVIYSPNFHNKSALQPVDDPYLQFEWLNKTLTEISALGGHAYILGHLPPTLDSYGQVPQWQDSYASAYMDLLAVHSDAVAAQLFGHVHKDEFRVWRSGWPEGKAFPPMLIAGALEAHYNNNPAYKMVDFEHSTGAIRDYKVRAAPVMATDGTQDPLSWSDEYRFSEEYSFSGDGITNSVLLQLHDRMQRAGNSLGGDWAKYWAFRAASYISLEGLQVNDWYTSPFISSHSEDAEDAELQLVRQLCVLQSFSSTDFDACVDQGSPTSS